MPKTIVSFVCEENPITVVQNGKQSLTVVSCADITFNGTTASVPALASPFMAGEDIQAFDVVVAFGNEIFRADASNPAHIANVVGVALNAATVGASVNVASQGRVTNPSFSFDSTLPVFLSIVPGELVQDDFEAVDGAAFSLLVGRVRNSDTIDINIGDPIAF